MTSQFIKRFSLRDLFDPHKICLFLKVEPYTMVSYERLTNAYELSRLIEKTGIPGAFVECGVWRGGCIAVMAYVAKQFGSSRKIWLFDSFEGVPEPTLQDGKKAEALALGRTGGRLDPIRQYVASVEDVEELFFSKLKIQKTTTIIRKGWFQETLPKAKKEIGPIALLRLDGDWYESTKVCLEHLYDQVVSGGYVIVDDYGYWEGCRKAVDEFFGKRKREISWHPIDDTGRYFYKP